MNDGVGSRFSSYAKGGMEIRSSSPSLPHLVAWWCDILLVGFVVRHVMEHSANLKWNQAHPKPKTRM